MSQPTEPMKVVDFNTSPKFIQEAILDEIAKCLTVAGKHGGRVIGNFVRDVIVPRQNNRQCDVTLNTITIWFKPVADWMNFVKEMGSALKRSGDVYHLVKDNTILVDIKITTCNDLIHSYFDIDTLAYTYNGDLYSAKGMCYPINQDDHLSVENIRNNILNKQTTILSARVYYFHHPFTDKKHAIHSIYEQYTNKGWTVIYNETKIPPNITIDELTKMFESAAPVTKSEDLTTEMTKVPSKPNTLRSNLTAQDKLDILLKLDADINQLRLDIMKKLEL